VVAFGVVFAAYWTIVGMGALDEPAGVLTTLPYRDVVAGVLLAEYVQVLLLAGLTIVGIAAAFAVYSVLLILIGLPGLLSQLGLLVEGLAGIVGAPQVVLFFVGLIVTVLLAIADAVLGYQRAVRTFDDYAL